MGLFSWMWKGKEREIKDTPRLTEGLQKGVVKPQSTTPRPNVRPGPTSPPYLPYKKYKCQLCGAIGTRDALRIHQCLEGAPSKFNDDHSFVDGLIFAEVVSEMSHSHESSSPDPLEGGGGTFGGGGASGSWDNSDSGSSSSDSSDSGSSSDSSCGSSD